jgi:hypothetical protein
MGNNEWGALRGASEAASAAKGMSSGMSAEDPEKKLYQGLVLPVYPSHCTPERNAKTPYCAKVN